MKVGLKLVGENMNSVSTVCRNEEKEIDSQNTFLTYCHFTEKFFAPLIYSTVKYSLKPISFSYPSCLAFGPGLPQQH